MMVISLLVVAPAVAQTAPDADPPAEDAENTPRTLEIERFPGERARDVEKRKGWYRAPIDEPLITDRPDFTESTEAVPIGRFQLEMGYTFTYDKEDDVKTSSHTAPEFLLRIGLAEDFELRLIWEGYSYEFTAFETRTRVGRPVDRDDWSQGSNDFNIGFKYKLFEQDGLLPHFGVIVGMSMPTGSAGFSAGDVEPEAVLLWAYDVTDDFSVAGNVGLFLLNDEDDHFFQTSASLSLAYAITDRVGVYGEYFGFYPNAEHADAAHTLNGGVTYLVNNNVQLDWRAGVGLNEEADDFFTGVGISVRW